MTGDEANILASYHKSPSESHGAWRTITCELSKSRDRLDDAEILVFDIWQVIPYGLVAKQPEIVENIVRAAWSMCKTGERRAIGLLRDSDPTISVSMPHLSSSVSRCTALRRWAHEMIQDISMT